MRGPTLSNDVRGRIVTGKLVRRAGGLLVLVLAACSEPRIVGTGGGPGGGVGGAPGGATGGADSGYTIPDADFTFKVPDGGADAPAFRAVDATCGFQKHQLERLAPEVMLLLDRSGSMTMGVDGSNNSRWTEATAALTDVLSQTSGAISWGLKNFPTPDGCDVLPSVEVPVGPTSKPVVDTILATTPNGGAPGTPTADAVTVATSYLRTLTSKSARYLVLATDGEPSCPSFGDAETPTLAAITAARNAGFPTFVIGIATAGTDADRVLNAMATAGGHPRAAMPAYYPVGNRKSVVDALAQIARVVASCTFPLDKDPPSPDDVAVDVDGMRIMRDPTETNGWSYGPGARVITLHGAACDRVKSGTARNVDIIFGCPNVPIP